MESAFGIEHMVSKSINPKNLPALNRAATKARTFARDEQHRNLPTDWARGRLRSRAAGHDLARRGGLSEAGLSPAQVRTLNPHMNEGSRGRLQSKAALYMVQRPSKRNLP